MAKLIAPTIDTIVCVGLDWGISPGGLTATVGFSAGSRVAGTLAVQYADADENVTAALENLKRAVEVSIAAGFGGAEGSTAAPVPTRGLGMDVEI